MAGQKSDSLFAPGGPFEGMEIITSAPEPEKRRMQDIVAQQEFMGFVEGLRVQHVAPLPDLSELLDHETKRTSGLDVPLDGDNDRAFLSSSFYEYVEHDKFPNRLFFRPQPLMRLGRENSYQQVFFGNLNAQWFHGAEQANVQIAVKPIPLRGNNPEDSMLGEERLLHEVAMYQYLGKLGIPTLEVLGVCLLKGSRNGLEGFAITRFDPDIVTMDNLPWGSMEPKDVNEAIGQVTDTLALLHSNLIFHGDPEFKNIAVGEASKSITVVDVERAKSGLIIPDNVKRIGLNMSMDFTDVEKSMGEFIFSKLPEGERPKDDIERFNILHNFVFEPYFERLVHLDSPYLDTLAKAYELMVDYKASMARGEDIPTNFWLI